MTTYISVTRTWSCLFIIFKNLHLRDLDEIDADLAVGKVEKLLDRDVDYDKTGLGQFYCVHCS